MNPNDNIRDAILRELYNIHQNACGTKESRSASWSCAS